jgi:hypothetical protein
MSALPQAASPCQFSISLEDFECANVDPEQFDHEAHVFVAWSYLQKYELDESIERFSSALRRLTRKLGVESKYHETITWFFLILIAERQGKSKDWLSFKRGNPDLFTTQPSIIRAYYSDERLGSPTARSQFVMPDRLPQST